MIENTVQLMHIRRKIEYSVHMLKVSERNTTFALQMMQSTEIITQKGVKVSLFFVPPVPNGNEIIP